MERLDTSLLDGFRFACRPTCGLCCFASPHVPLEERAALLAAVPDALGAASGDHVPARAGGGACRLLSLSRCTAHAARPAPCREFPVSVHLGPRAQATLVLSCPGLDLTALAPARPDRSPAGPVGLETELAAARATLDRLDPRAERRARRGWREALDALGVEDPLALAERREAAATPLNVSATALRDEGLPDEADGLENLPLFHDDRFGTVAIAGSGAEVDLLVLRESGGVDRRLATYPRLERRPALDPSASEILEGYRAHLLARDGVVGAAALRALEAGPPGLSAALGLEVDAVLGATLARAAWRQQLEGRSGGSLEAAAVLAGIRATDADFLDRPTIGLWL